MSEVKQQPPLTVHDEDGTVIGEHFADPYVQNTLIVELKAAKGLADEPVAQVLGYLRASRIEHGLLMNSVHPRSRFANMFCLKPPNIAKVAHLHASCCLFLVIISSGFREMGSEGAELERRLLAVARKSGIRIIGPNCLGVILPHRSINTTFDPTAPRKGHIAFISQSGAIITTIVDWSVPEEIGFSAIVSVGNQIDLDFTDIIRFAAQDDETRAVILYIEEIKDGRSFMNTVREITRIKPVIILKSGSSALGKKAASSHTGSPAGNFEVYKAAFRQAGGIQVYSLREAFDVA